MLWRNVYVFMAARDEAANLPACLEALLGQTLKPSKIVVVNDVSLDDTAEVAASYGVTVVTLTVPHESYTKTETGWLVGLVWNHAFPIPPSADYVMQIAPDTVLPSDYIERLVGLMEANTRLVVASGVIRGERNLRGHARGVGRLYKAWFWNRHVKRFPLAYCTESFPLFKALSLGLQVRSFPSLVMETQRPTAIYKGKYGYAMRELGYFPPFAIAKCFLSFLASPKDGALMFTTYLTSPFKPKDIAAFLPLHQIGRLLHVRESLKFWVSRIRRRKA